MWVSIAIAVLVVFGIDMACLKAGTQADEQYADDSLNEKMISRQL